MRVLEVHNYHAIRGGSDVMFDLTISALRTSGHDVMAFVRDNVAIREPSHRIHAAVSSFYSWKSKTAIEGTLRDFDPDIVHVHNVYPLISTAAVEACAAKGYPVLFRLADQTLLCPTSHCFRSGEVCTECIGGHEYQCILHNCRNHLLTSAVYAGRTACARVRRVFHSCVAGFTAPSHFLKGRYQMAGFDERKLHLIPNMVPIPVHAAIPSSGKYIAFLGRFSPEKGVSVLLNAARRVNVPIHLAGPGSEIYLNEASSHPNVRIVGELSRGDVPEFLAGARCLVVPSLCEESFCLTCAEALATGIPVIASRRGALPEMITHGRNGFLFAAGDCDELAARMEELWTDWALADRLGTHAREGAVRDYGQAAYARRLAGIFEEVRSSLPLKCKRDIIESSSI